MVTPRLDSLSQFYSVATEVSLLLAKNQLGDIDRTITEVLGILGRFAQVERSYVFTFDFSKGESYYKYEWCAEGVEPQIDLVATVSIEDLAPWVECFQKGDHVYLPSIPEMEPSELKTILDEQEIKSLIVYPMYHGEELLGFVGFDAVEHFRQWGEEHFGLLKIACETIGSTLSSKRFREELVAAKLMAEQANRSKSEFLANMSHELRSPLNSVIGFSDLIEMEIAENRFEKVSEYVGLIKAGGKHLLSMINDILDLSRIETGDMQVEIEQVDLREIVDLVRDLIRLSADRKGVQLEVQQPDEPAYTCADQTRIRQVIYNLLSNAIKFTESGKAVGVLIERRNDEWMLEIWDEGRGIPEAFHERIFEPFQQVDPADATELGGTGLGLAIVTRIVDLHAGRIELESAPGQGSRFRVFMPARTMCEEALGNLEPPHKLLSARRGGKPRRVLCVDDIDANRTLLSEGLPLGNFQVSLAECGQKAIETCQSGSFDLVLLDIKLPDIDGFEVHRQLKALYPDQPVIAVTASLTEEIRQRISDAGFDGCHGKPIELNQLLNLMDRVLVS